MKLEIVSIRNHGKAAEEYVLLKVLKDCKLNEHILTDSTYQDSGRISNRLRHMYWWPGTSPANAGDFVFVYTREGKDAVRHIKDSVNVYRDFYWGLKSAIWNDTGDAAVLIEIAAWTCKRSGKT
jgi:hypothetical protein